MNNDIETRITGASTLLNFFGKELSEEFKRDIKDVMVAQIKEDFEGCGDYLISPYEIEEIAQEALSEVRAKIKKMYKGAFLEIAEKSVERMLSNEKVD